MSPTKTKDITKETALEMGVDPQMAEDLISFYWDEIHKLLISLEHLRVRVTGFGKFSVKLHSLERTVRKYKSMLRYKKIPKTFNSYDMYKEIEKSLESLSLLGRTLQREYKKRTLILKKRHAKAIRYDKKLR